MIVMDIEKIFGKERLLKFINGLRLIDDVFFSLCFADNVPCVEYILQIILDKNDLKVDSVAAQKTVENIYGRSVRLDVFATDAGGKMYNIEVQRTDAGAVPNRARYNSAMMDYHKLKQGEPFKVLPESFVIFITENDVLKGGKIIYHIDRIVRETGKNFGDGTHIIYVNGNYKDDSGSQLGDLIHDFFCINPADMRLKILAERAAFVRSNKGWELNKMNPLFAEIFKDELETAHTEGKAEGAKENFLANVRELMKNLHFTAAQAMDALGVPADKQKEYADLI